MTAADLAATVNALRPGDRVRATFSVEGDAYTVEGAVCDRLNGLAVGADWLADGGNRVLNNRLVAVEVLEPDYPDGTWWEHADQPRSLWYRKHGSFQAHPIITYFRYRDEDPEWRRGLRRVHLPSEAQQ